MLVQPDESIMVAGLTIEGAITSATLARYTAGGAVDGTFGTNGRTTSTVMEAAYALVRLADGKIVLAGRNQNDFAFARFDAQGVLDTSFGTGGAIYLDFYGAYDEARAAALQPDGRVVAAGVAVDGSSTIMGLARVLP